MPEAIHVKKAHELAPLSVNLQDAARLIGLSARTVRELVRSGDLPAVQPGGPGGKILFRVATLDRWLEERERAGAKVENLEAVR